MAGCAVAIVAIWINIVAQLSAPKPTVKETLPESSNALPGVAVIDSVIRSSPLFAPGPSPDLFGARDPFWPFPSAEHTNAGVVIDSSSASSPLSNITFYGTLQHNRKLLGLIGDKQGFSHVVSAGDSLRDGMVETVTEDGIAVRVSGVKCLVERRR